MLASRYERVWNGHQDGGDQYYNAVRDRYNDRGDEADLLYLLARCVKNSPRWNRRGQFNQSADKRRLGMRPGKMRVQILDTHGLLKGRTKAIAGDFESTIATATERDLVYMDPPYEGTSGTRDSRYHQGLDRERLISALASLNRRSVPWILSYDGRCGDKSYGTPLPSSLHATRLELEAGRSSQATLNGEASITVESLYVSSAFVRARVEINGSDDQGGGPLGGSAEAPADRASSKLPPGRPVGRIRRSDVSFISIRALSPKVLTAKQISLWDCEAL